MKKIFTLLFTALLVPSHMLADELPVAILKTNADKTKTLTFTYTDSKNITATGGNDGAYQINLKGEAPGWVGDPENPYSKMVTKVVFEPAFAKARPTTTYEWFAAMEKLDTIVGIEYLNTSAVTIMDEMFSGCAELRSVDLSHFKTDNVTSMAIMFSGCSSLNTLNVSSFNTANVEDMTEMFSGCSSLTSLDLSSFNTTKVGYMTSMFQSCGSLKSVNVKSFDTSNVESMLWMFADCSALESIDVSKFNTSKVYDMGGMFSGCAALKALDISSFKVDSLTVNFADNMFDGCTGLTSLNVGDNDFKGIKSQRDLFKKVGTATTPCHLTIGSKFDKTVLGEAVQGEGNAPSYYKWGGGYFALDTTNGISHASTMKAHAESPAYNLSGQRVGKDYKGVVIIDGKKVIRK